MSYRIRSRSPRTNTQRSAAHTAGAVTLAAALVVLGACNRDVTEPAAARTLTPGASARTVVGAAVWNERTVAIESKHRNSAGQLVCLDVPWGQAFDGQDVNYYPCHYLLAQQFVLTAWDAGAGGTQSWVRIKAKSNPAFCIDIRGGTNGGEHLQLFTCKPIVQSSNQTFLIPAATTPGAAAPLVTTVCVLAGYPNLVFDLPLPAVATSFVQQSGLNHGDNQLWQFKDIPSGQYFGAVAGNPNPWNKC